MSSRHRIILVTALLAAMLGYAAISRSAGMESPRVALLELYTSEGCNSCPPMDRWVSSLPRPGLVPERLVVLAFHVDYWNYLGWRDRFSQADFTTRQQTLVRANGLRTAYTPQVVLNGRDYRNFGSIDSQVARVHAEAASAQIRLEATRHGATLRITAVVEPVRLPGPDTSLYLAVYENNLETRVKAGENRGRQLHHDYVVRTLLHPTAVAAGTPTRRVEQLTLPADWKAGDLGVAAFIQHNRTGEVLQATAQPVR